MPLFAVAEVSSLSYARKYAKQGFGSSFYIKFDNIVESGSYSIAMSSEYEMSYIPLSDIAFVVYRHTWGMIYE